MSVNDEKRVTVRMSQQEYDQIKHFANREDVSVNQFILNSCEHYQNWILKDFDVPTAMVQRQNQMVESINRLNSTQANLVKTITYFTDTFFNVTGTKDLLNHDEGGDK